MSYHITWFLPRCCALCKVIEYISSVKEVSSITDCEVWHPLLVNASCKLKTMLLRSHLKSELLKSWHLFLQPGFIFALFMQELVVSSFANITNDNDQDRLIHANQALKNFELSLSFWHDSSESLTCTELFMSTQISLFKGWWQLCRDFLYALSAPFPSLKSEVVVIRVQSLVLEWIWILC